MVENYSEQREAGRNLLLRDFEEAFGLYPSEVIRIAGGVDRKTLQQAIYESYSRRVELGIPRRERLPVEDVEEILDRFNLWA